MATYKFDFSATFVLRSVEMSFVRQEYMHILEKQKELNQINYIRGALNAFKKPSLEVQLHIVNDLNNEGDLVIKATLRAEDLEAYCDVLTWVESSSSLGTYSYEPAICVGTHSINKEQKLELLFAGYVL